MYINPLIYTELKVGKRTNLLVTTSFGTFMLFADITPKRIKHIAVNYINTDEPMMSAATEEELKSIIFQKHVDTIHSFVSISSDVSEKIKKRLEIDKDFLDHYKEFSVFNQVSEKENIAYYQGRIDSANAALYFIIEANENVQ